jgi:hypothetical protein
VRGLCENLESKIITTKALHRSKPGSTESESKCIKLMNGSEVLYETKWSADTDISFGEDPIRNLGKFSTRRRELFNNVSVLFALCDHLK